MIKKRKVGLLSISLLSLVVFCTQQQQQQLHAGEKSRYLAEKLEVCGLSPAALHLTAHSGGSVPFHYSLQYFKLICCPKKKKTGSIIKVPSCFHRLNAFNVKPQQEEVLSLLLLLMSNYIKAVINSTVLESATRGLTYHFITLLR